MTAVAERLLEQIRTLGAADIEELRESVAQLARGARSSACPSADPVRDAISASKRLFAGSGLTEKLLEERARDRNRE